MGRGSAGDTTSLLNIGEEYRTSERMVDVMFIYILNCHGQPLMPCQPRKARLLLRQHNTAPKYVHGFRLFDCVRYHGQVCFVFGRRSSGYFDLRTLDGIRVHASASSKKLTLAQRASALLVERRAAFPPVP